MSHNYVIVQKHFCWKQTQLLGSQDRFPADLEGAVAAVRSRGDTDTANLWQEALDNLTMGTPGDSLNALVRLLSAR